MLYEVIAVPFAVSHRPADHPYWVELLALGLTFDLGGLAPVTAADDEGLDREAARASVTAITSYSIHYTKLYETAAAGRPLRHSQHSLRQTLFQRPDGG